MYMEVTKLLLKKFRKTGDKYCNVPFIVTKDFLIKDPKEIKGIKLVYIPTVETKMLSQPIHSFFIVYSCLFFKTRCVILVVNSAKWSIWTFN